MLLGDIIDFNARKHPDKIAVGYQGKTYTWSQFQNRVNQISNALLKIAKRGDRVAIWSQNNYEYTELIYGISMAGMITTILNYRLNPKEIEWIINNAEATVLILENQYLEGLSQLELPSVKHIICIGGAPNITEYESWITGSSIQNPELSIRDEDVCALVYTSGTTGRPKGAMITHKNLMANVYNQLIAYQLAEDNVFLFPFPLAHIVFHAMITLHYRGCPVYIMRSYDPGSWLADVQSYKITATCLAPTMITTLLEHPNINQYDLSTLRAVLYGGSGIPAEILRRAIDKFGNVFMQGFGMTETAGSFIFLNFADHLSILNGNTHLLKAAGKVACGASVRIVDDKMNDVPIGETGELVIRADQVCKGYWRNPEATEAAFAGGWFHGGDMAKMDKEGYIYIVDRKKDMIITGGENVYCKEVEDIIYKNEAVFEVAVFGVPDLQWGENVVAAVALKPGMLTTEEEIINLCLGNLARYKRPKKVVFVDALPKNSSGKILKRELRDQFVNLFV